MGLVELFCLLLTLTAFAAWFRERQKAKKTLEQLRRMLDAAIGGHFTEDLYDESLLSSVEAKLGRYLSLSTSLSKNLREEKEKMNSLISDISHQTKTPISNILLYSQLLSEQNLPPDCAICVQALTSQAEKLSFLILALVKTSRLETGIITVSPQPGEIQACLSNVREQILPTAKAKDVSIVLEDTAVCACYDPKWTAEAVYNIVDNAVKYSNNGGTILIKTVAYELFCRIDISDTGIGISEDEQGKIFCRFYRSPRVRNQEGIGIGLYLAREIITAQGGYLKVSSNPGNGSTFSVFLPSAQ